MFAVTNLEIEDGMRHDGPLIILYILTATEYGPLPLEVFCSSLKGTTERSMARPTAGEFRYCRSFPSETMGWPATPTTGPNGRAII